jgi:hypothetical protein
MVPQPKDVRDVIQMFAGRKGPRPVDRYLRKFDYYGVLGRSDHRRFGVAAMVPRVLLRICRAGRSASPRSCTATRPSWLFHFTVHFFNVHLRPEKFPIDVVIFTGRATADYMKEEHPLEYERIVREGRLEELKASRPSRTLYVWAVGLGFASLALGIGIIVCLGGRRS